jgi:hypothetical protein
MAVLGSESLPWASEVCEVLKVVKFGSVKRSHK